MRFLSLLRVGVFAVTLAVFWAVSVSAQTGTGAGGATQGGTTAGTTNRDDDTDWGWVGLLGLGGLAGLLRRRDAPARDRAPDMGGRATAR